MSFVPAYEVVHEPVRHIIEPPRQIIAPNYPAIAIEELSQRYKGLIEAERKHFLAAEHEYNDFICKMDIIHQDLEEKLAHTLHINDELAHDNEELARRFRDLEIEHERKCETLRKLYAVHVHQTKRLECLEFDNVDLRATADRTTDANFEIHSDFKNVLAERNFLDERMADMQARHHAEMNRLNMIITDKDRFLLDRDRELDRLNDELRRVLDENHRLKMDLDSIRMNSDGLLHQRELEIAHLRRLLEDQRHIPTAPIPVIDNSGQDETIRKLRANLDDAYRTIEELQKRKQIVEKPVERIIRVPVEQEREVYAKPVVDDDRLERVLIFARKTWEKKLKPLYYTIWKLIYHIEYLERMKKQSPEKILRAVPAPTEGVVVFHDGLVSVYHDLRRGIVDYLFEIFVRSANHAHQKKVNSLILFIVNIRELKEHNLRIFMILLDTFMRIRQVVKTHCKKSHTHPALDYALDQTKSRIKSPVRSPDKRKTVDAEFRDMTNSWIQDSLENVRKRRGYDKNNPHNMEYLYLFRLLAIKYRCVYPLRGKALMVDADLAVKLETRICKAFLRALEVNDVNSDL